MAFCSSKIDQTAFAEQIKPLAVLKSVFFNKVPDDPSLF